MKIHEALETIRNMKPSQYDDPMLLRWLSELDGHVWEDLLCKYGVPAPFLPYREGMNARDLLIPFPHDAIYLNYLGAQIDYYNGEFERYNNSMMLYNAQLQEYYNAFTRTHERPAAVMKGVKTL